MCHRVGEFLSFLVLLSTEPPDHRHPQYRAKNDMVNPIAAGFVAGGVLARNAGPKAAFGGGVAFAAFSAVIDLFLRRETAE